LVKDIYEYGRLADRQYLNKDSIPDGPEFNYFSNGDIKKWKWYSKSFTPSCNVYFFKNKIFDTCQGSPFLGTYYDSVSILWVRTIRPPYFRNVILGYRDFFEGKLMKQFGYTYKETDTGLLFPLIDHKEEQGHTYLLSFYMLDSAKKIIFMVETNLENKTQIY
jgi:hypothetical protein